MEKGEPKTTFCERWPRVGFVLGEFTVTASVGVIYVSAVYEVEMGVVGGILGILYGFGMINRSGKSLPR
jgi:hypothetical protein